MTWRTARSLDIVLDEINAHAPRRSKASDGSIGDTAHSSRASDHNPNGAGVVRARDFTHDPAGGLDCNDLAERLAVMLRRDGPVHPALQSGAYVIWNGRIISRDRIDEGWRRYSGSNPHDKHLHLSVATKPLYYDTTLPWILWPKPRPKRPTAVRTAIKAIRARLAERPGPAEERRLRKALARLLRIKKR